QPRQVVEDVEHSIRGLVGRDWRVPVPGTVGILVELVSGSDAAVHSGHVEAEGPILRLACSRGLRGGGACGKRKHCGSGERGRCECEGKQSNHLKALRTDSLSLDKVRASRQGKSG